MATPLPRTDCVAGVRPPAVAPGAPCPRPIRVGLINNPRSGRNARRGGLDAIAPLLREHAALRHHEAAEPDDIAAATRRLLDDGAEILVANGGDGTLQAMLTAVLGADEPGPAPVFAVLPGGTTNMTARDLGAGRLPARALAAILAAARDGRVAGRLEQRPVVRVTGAGRAPRLGLFFGAGAVYHGIELCRDHIETKGLRGEAGPGLAVAIFVWDMLRGRRSTVFPPFELTLRYDDGEMRQGTYTAMLGTTLRQLFLGLRPFWGTEDAPLRFTAVRDAPQYVPRVIWPIARGRQGRWVRAEHGYESRNVSGVTLEFDGGYTLDGELYRVPPGGLRVDGTVRAHFLRLT